MASDTAFQNTVPGLLEIPGVENRCQLTSAFAEELLLQRDFPYRDVSVRRTVARFGGGRAQQRGSKRYQQCGTHDFPREAIRSYHLANVTHSGGPALIGAKAGTAPCPSVLVPTRDSRSSALESKCRNH
jgi:hypothetical protein